MKFISILGIFSLFLVATNINARKDIGEYWRDVMKGEAMPEVVKELTGVADKEEKSFVNGIKPKPTLWIYDQFDSTRTTIIDHDASPQKKKSLIDGIKPKPTFWIYDN